MHESVCTGKESQVKTDDMLVKKHDVLLVDVLVGHPENYASLLCKQYGYRIKTTRFFFINVRENLHVLWSA